MEREKIEKWDTEEEEKRKTTKFPNRRDLLIQQQYVYCAQHQLKHTELVVTPFWSICKAHGPKRLVVVRYIYCTTFDRSAAAETIAG